ncbi:hypothetical protein [Mycolicibacterium llatzerense]|uniref:hypothetical protein n=1 Tax=Mycolicibacterium llatzerense TaxID=280871 RepID=UPI0021B6C237|nr:hypothetical protein [Mycolicibacterium llatzerense]MCT7371885.1 hypothetical protein [Mycolicibacterium llatzerense]
MTHTLLPRHIDNIVTGPAPVTLADAIANYQHLELPIGVDDTGAPRTWPIRRSPHAMMLNTGAAGLSTAVRTIVTQAAHAGMRVVIADFMPAFTEHDLRGFQGWPNIQSATDNPYANIAAIADVHDRLWQRRIDEGDHEPLLLVVNGITNALSWLENRAPELDEATRHYWWNPTARDRDPLQPRPVLKHVREALTRIAALGREMRIHLLLTDLCRSGFRHDVHQLAHNTSWHLVCGTRIPIAASQLLGDQHAPKRPPAQPDDIRYSALLRATGDSDDAAEFTPLRVYWTPGPNTVRSDKDRNLLAALRPEHSLYPPVDSELPEDIASWDDLFAATAFLPMGTELHNAAPAPHTGPDSDPAAQFMASVWTKLDRARRNAENSTRTQRFRRRGSAAAEALSRAAAYRDALDIVRSTATEYGLRPPGES